jgi:leucyl-tRNA synthetase
MPLLAKATAWMNTTAGAAGVDPALLPPETPVTRETNTMPGSAGSSWYAMRYCDPRCNAVGSSAGREAEKLLDGQAVTAWTCTWAGRARRRAPALLALLAERAVRSGRGDTREPFQGKLFHQGLITSFAYQRPDKTIVPTDEVREEVGDKTSSSRSRPASRCRTIVDQDVEAPTRTW